MGTSGLGPYRLGLVVPHLKTPMLIRLYHLLWFYLLPDSEFSCLAMLAKPYPVSGPTPLPQIPNQLHCVQRVHMKCLVPSLGPESCQFLHKIIYFVCKPLEHCIEIYICLPICSPPLVHIF